MNEMRRVISRREFLRAAATMGGLAAMAPFLEACDQVGEKTPTPTTTPTVPPMPTATPAPTITPTPTPIPEAEMSKVVLVKTRDRAEGVRRALKLWNLNPVQGKKVFLKPNFNSADPTPGSTHNAVLRSLVEELWGMGAQAITVGDRSGMDVAANVMQVKGVLDMAQELDFETIAFEKLEKGDWELIQPPDSHWKNGFFFARPCLEAEALVQTCCLKPHRYGGHFSMSLKNSVGMIAGHVPGDSHDYMTELHSTYQRVKIAEINTAYTPALVVLDGVEAFVSGGPDTGIRKWADVVLVGTDRVAIDAVAVAVLLHLGYKGHAGQGRIFEQDQIARAVELGLGADRPEKIELVTDDPDSAAYAAQIRTILLQG